jgi:hypothetical protein
MTRPCRAVLVARARDRSSCCCLVTFLGLIGLGLVGLGLIGLGLIGVVLDLVPLVLIGLVLTLVLFFLVRLVLVAFVLVRLELVGFDPEVRVLYGVVLLPDGRGVVRASPHDRPLASPGWAKGHAQPMTIRRTKALQAFNGRASYLLKGDSVPT